MAGIDKAAIAFSIAITAIGAGIAFAGDSMEFSTPVSTPSAPAAPTVSTETSEPEPGSDPFADLAQKVKDEAKMAEKEEPMMEKESMMEKEEPAAMAAGPQTHAVDMPKGTSVPGCEETNECYTPADITINVGDTVEWINVDTAAHTVTSGSPADGPSGVFDSSLVMADAVYAFTFEEAGTYDYFCMVHPWMVGSVTVN